MDEFEINQRKIIDFYLKKEYPVIYELPFYLGLFDLIASFIFTYLAFKEVNLIILTMGLFILMIINSKIMNYYDKVESKIKTELNHGNK